MKKCVCFLLQLLIFVSFVFAQEDAPTQGLWANGEKGSGTWKFEQLSSILTIEGVGEMENYHTKVARRPWQAYLESVKKIKIGENITSIGNAAFRDMQNLESVDFATTITRIGSSAFYGDTFLASVDFPETLEEIGDNAFRKCSSLKRLDFPKNLSLIGTYSFYSCSNVTDIVFKGDKLEEIADYAFPYASKLQNVKLPSSLKRIGDYAFYYASGALETIELPESLEIIGDRAFAYDKMLTSIIIPNNVRKIGDLAFLSCGSMTDIKLSENLESIGRQAFEYCKKLKKIEFPNTLRSIGDSAFYGCVSFERIDIPNSVTAVGNFAFQNETKLKIFSIGENLDVVRLNWLDKNSRLEELISYSKIPPVLDITNSNIPKEKITLYVPLKSLNDYRLSDWNIFMAIEPISSLLEVNIIEMPSKLEYRIGEDLVLDGKLELVYDDDIKDTILMTDEDVACFGFNNKTAGEQEVTLDYKGFTSKFSVNVINEVNSLEIKTLPNKIEYRKGDTKDLSGGSVILTYDDGSQMVLEMDSPELTIRGFDRITPGENQIYVDYQDLTTEFTIIYIKSPESIVVSVAPSKLEYKLGEEMDVENGVIRLIYDDGSSKDIDMIDPEIIYTGFDNTQYGINTITVDYHGFTTTFDIEFIKIIVSIIIVELPNKVEYYIGEDLDLEGGKVECEYEAGGKDTMLMSDPIFNISGFDNASEGTKSVRLQHKEVYVDFEVEVRNRPVELRVKELPSKIEYGIGEKFEPQGGVLELVYADGKIETYEMTAANIVFTGFENTQHGSKQILVSFMNLTTSFEVFVDRKMVGIEMYILPKTMYEYKESLDTSGGILSMIYDDASKEHMFMGDSGVSVLGFDSKKTGTEVLTVKFNGFSTTYSVFIIKRLASVKIEKLPAKIEYKLHEELDLAEGMLNFKYNDYTSDLVSMETDSLRVSGFSSDTAGMITVTISVDTFSVSFEVVVLDELSAEMREEMANVSVYTVRKNIMITGAKIGRELDVFDEMGRLIYKDFIMNDKTKVAVNNPGVYVVKVGAVTHKVVVR